MLREKTYLSKTVIEILVEDSGNVRYSPGLHLTVETVFSHFTKKLTYSLSKTNSPFYFELLKDIEQHVGVQLLLEP